MTFWTIYVIYGIYAILERHIENFSPKMREIGDFFAENESDSQHFRTKCIRLATSSPKMRQMGNIFAQNVADW